MSSHRVSPIDDVALPAAGALRHELFDAIKAAAVATERNKKQKDLDRELQQLLKDSEARILQSGKLGNFSPAAFPPNEIERLKR